MSRPYRHVDTETLKETHDTLYAKVQSYARQGLGISYTGGERRELKRVAKELDRRSKGEDFQR